MSLDAMRREHKILADKYKTLLQINRNLYTLFKGSTIEYICQYDKENDIKYALWFDISLYNRLEQYI